MERITLIRRISQVGFLLLTGEWLTIGWLRCPYGVPFVSCMSCPLRSCPGTWLQPYFLALIGISSLAVGRAFCGWACPMGLIEEVLGRVPRLRLERLKGFAGADRWLKWLKWPALAAVIYLVFALNYPPGRGHPYVVRTGSAFNLDAIRVAWGMGGRAYCMRAAILGAALVGAVVLMRAWCRYCCPFGALLGLFNKISFIKLWRDEATCENCSKYPRECVQHTVPGTTDCIICGDCISGCPRDAIGLRSRGFETDPQPGRARCVERVGSGSGRG
jgi:ferredoxin-type protein NapH